jgi:hypothetical protein
VSLPPLDLDHGWNGDVLAGDLSAVDPKGQLEQLRALVHAACAADRPLVPLFTAMASLDPIALSDLAVGPRAPAGPRLTEAALAVVEVLEGQVSVGALYRRLLVLARGDALDVLEIAAQRHPAAGWLVALSDRAGEHHPGRTHLVAASHSPGFTQACWAHAAAGHLDGLLAVAQATGRAEPAAALLAHGATQHALQAVAHLIEHAPRAPVAAHLAGVWGPDLDALWLGVLPLLDTQAARERLLGISEGSRRLRAAMI